jgi:di/tricarboxylate transporter
MTAAALITIACIVGALAVMAAGLIRAELALFGALGLLMLLGVIDPSRALSGFANQGMHTVALLFIVAEGVRRSGIMETAIRLLFGTTRKILPAQVRLLIPVAGASAFFNNTPIVAMLLPVVRSWCRSVQLPASLMLIPLSYATILGGLCTILGTSTNLVVAGMVKTAGLPVPGFFEIGRVGLPICAAGLVLLFFLSRLLPRRKPEDLLGEDPRSFTSEFIVEPDGPLAGKRIDEIRVSAFQRLFPVEIERGETIIPAPHGGEMLQAGDRLVIAGEAGHIIEAQGIAGLRSARDHQFGPDEPERRRRQVEIVVSHTCPLVGHSVGDGSFRRRYNAAVIAVARHGERVERQGLKGWRLQAGDSLLVEAAPGFIWQHRFNPDFYVVTDRPELAPTERRHVRVAMAIFIAMIALAACEALTMFQASLAAAFLLIGLRVISWNEARASLDTGILLAIAAAVGLGEAMVASGAAEVLAGYAVSLGGDNPWRAMALIYIATVICTEVVTNNAAAAVMVPPALATAHRLGVSYEPFIFAVMIAASASFITPIGYQTNLMVYGPGGYRFTDYMKVGIPMSLAAGALAIGLIPRIWPF